VPPESGLGRRSLGSFSGHVTAAASPRTIVLGEVYSPGWKATLGVEGLRHAQAFGWSNRFTVPPGASGTVRISYAGEWIRIAWVVGGGALIALALIMAFAARRPKAEGQGPPPLLQVKAERPLARGPSSRVRVVAPAPRAPAPRTQAADAPRRERS
jgi:hypothetical protein